MYPKVLQQLIEKFRYLPGVGEKTAERYALRILDLNEDQVQSFAQALLRIKSDLHECPICGNFTENEVCDICANKERDTHTICVVQEAKDILAIEKTGQFHGVYHVLKGAISTQKGILPQDLNIASLLDRIKEDTQEIIIATNPTLEGETTAMYVARILENKGVTLTRLAHGLPMGGHLDYTDELTLQKAFENRIKV